MRRGALLSLPPSRRGAAASLRIDRAIRLRLMSTSRTRTLTTSPALTTSCGSLTKRSASARSARARPGARRCRRRRRRRRRWSPCLPGPCRASGRRCRRRLPRSAAVLNSGRGSRPGFSSSDRMSRTVGRPKRSSTKAAGSRLFSAAAVAHQRCERPGRRRRRCCAPRRRPRGARRRRRAARRRRGCAGSRRTARRPLAPGAARRAAARRGGTGRARRGAATIVSASAAPRPETRASSGAEAVFRSTPTALTQSSTTASSARASRYWSTSCWYWPTPIDFGSIFTSSASGSCSRRAIDTAPRSDTSRSGNSAAPRTPRPNRPMRRPPRRRSSAAWAPAGRPAARARACRSRGCRAVADGDELDRVLADQRAPRVAERPARRCAAGADRWWPSRAACRWRRRRRP